MTKVFLGGSRHISRLNSQVRERLDNMIDKALPIMIGDANGADKAMQVYLSERGYRDMEVFCSGAVCRNNIGGWRVRHVAAGAATGASFYSAKDRAMAAESDIGLMLWDGSSIGTIANVFRLVAHRKKAVLYSTAEKRFHEIRDERCWDDFLAACDPALRRKLAERVRHPLEQGEAARQRMFG